MQWAATHNVVLNGKQMKKAVGNCCMNCFTIIMDILHYKTLAAFFADLNAEPDAGALHTTIKTIRQQQAKMPAQEGQAWQSLGSDQGQKIAVEVSKCLVGVPEAKLKKALDTTRLTTKSTQSLVACLGPDLDDPSLDTTYYLFQKSDTDSEDVVDIKLCVSRSYNTRIPIVAPERNLYDGHAGAEMQHQMLEDSMVSACLKTGGKRLMPTFAAFIESYSGHVRKQARSAALATGAGGISGPAAEEFQVEEKEDDQNADDLLRDLTEEVVTPKKAAGLRRLASKSTVADPLAAADGGEPPG